MKKEPSHGETFYHRSWEHVSIDEFIDELDSYLRWYNEERIKMSLGAMSPITY
ncbi:MAG: IS3 family transposase, partial [Limnochordia bacterium]|nr:IS3 family transposase [Limnochordia bacterium]